MRLTELKGIGKKREECFNKLGINSVEDVVKDFPLRYEDRTSVGNIDQLKDGVSQVIYAKLSKLNRIVYLRGKKTIQKGLFSDETGTVEVRWYNQKFIYRSLHLGDSYCIFGRYNSEYKAIINPKIYLGEIEDFTGISPIYRLADGVSNSVRISAAKEAIEKTALSKFEILSKDFLEKSEVWDINKIIKELHFPTDIDYLYRARSDMSFRNWIVFLLSVMERKRIRKAEKSPDIKDVDIDKFEKTLSFHLTNAQKNVFSEIYSDLKRVEPMNRLLQGDVGSGKTVVALFAAYVVIKNGYKAALMAPTEVLANQHYRTAFEIFKKLNVPIYLLTGSANVEERNVFYNNSTSDEPALFIGTHTLFQEKTDFSKLGLIITDEQHRFGVNQRADLQKKSILPNSLVLSATPIPRTLNLVKTGDLELSCINELPPGRKPVETFVIDERYEKRMLSFVVKEVNKKHKVYIVCPRIDADEGDLERWSVEGISERYGKELGNSIKLGVLHGRMTGEEKTKILSEFESGDISVLISTTVIEVGVDVKDATLMVVLAAERFGLAQLHQLRGRVGRNDFQSYCVLLCASPLKSTIERLKILEKTQSGFEIAEKDLSLRGSGDKYGIRQHGIEPDLQGLDLLENDEMEKAKTFLMQFDSDSLRIDNLKEPLKTHVQNKLCEYEKIILN